MSTAPPTHALARCDMCERKLTACWRFSKDDKHCGLCGEQVLHLALANADPSGRVWLYRRPNEPIRLSMMWVRGKAKRPLAPKIDFGHSSAVLHDDNLGGTLTFDLTPGPPPKGEDPWATAHLTPRFAGFEKLPLPPGGVPLWLDIATSTGREQTKAILLPYHRTLLSWRCAEPSMKQDGDGVWQVYQKAKAVVLPMRLTAPVRLCVLGVRKQPKQATSPDIEVIGFERPMVLAPGEPYRFELRVNNMAWASKTAAPFHYYWTTTAGENIPLEGSVAFVEGRRLDVSAIDLREQVQLGEVLPATFGLVASDGDGIEEPNIEIRRYRVFCTPDEGDWLRVVKPSEEQLPLVVPPRGDGRNIRVLQLELDTTRLDRERFDMQVLEGRVDLHDSRERVWPCSLRVAVRRPPTLEHFIAIDWGTTNTCAAYSAEVGVKAPTPVLFDKYQPTPELFPSDLYFVDVSNPDKPEFKTGFHANVAGKTHPECLLRSLKRKFQLLDSVTVIDERQRTHKYPVEQIACLLLHRLICQAEVTTGHELLRFGLTFPTKWGPRARKRLADVARQLQEQLQEQRKGRIVEVQPPRIDEANAVALNYLTTGDGSERPKCFNLIAYDFGGGTVDTSILEFAYLEQTNQLRTRYVGIGGRPDFGGDDVTRAVMMILHDRLSAALKRRDLFGAPPPGKQAARAPEILLTPDREPLRDTTPQGIYWYRTGRANWNVLWEGAEAIKRDLCNSAADAAGAPVQNWVKENRSEIRCRIAGQNEDKPLLSLVVVLDGEKQKGFYDALSFSLADACGYPLPDIDNVNFGKPFTVSERVEDTIKELRAQCDDATQAQGRPVEPEIIVLAGGGCRLPLIKESMGRHFPPGKGSAARLIFQDDIAKQRVAHGMANYLAFLRHSPSSVEEMASSVDVLHHHMGLRRVRWQKGKPDLEFLPIVRAGTPADAPDAWRPFTFDRSQISGVGNAAGIAASGGARLMLYIHDWRLGQREFGYFDLTNPVDLLPGDPPRLQEPLPLAAGANYAGELRLRRPAENDEPAQRMEIRVTYQGNCYGPFPLASTVADPESVLHG